MLLRCSSDSGLEELLDETIRKIEKTLIPKASFPTPSIHFEQTLQSEDGRLHRIFLGPSQRITQQPESVARALLGASPGDIVRGVTLHNFGKIFLSENQWCIETLVHETLHRLSIFALRPDINRQYRLMVEGLTECFTEYLLSTHFADIYDSCLKKKGTYCSLTYAYETKIWCALTRVVGYHVIAPIYFWQGRSDWEALFGEFTLSIRKAGYPRFENVLEAPGKLAIMARLHQECGRRMGEKYGEAYRKLSERYS